MSYLAPAQAPDRARLFLVVSAAAWLGAVVWTWLVFAPFEPLQEYDRACALFWHDHSQPHSFWWETMVQLTDLGGIAAMAIITGMGMLWQWSLGRRRLALAWMAIATGGGMVDLVLKESFDRPRPPPEWRDVAVLQSNQSYPSGHSMGSSIGYGMLAYALGRGAMLRGRRRLSAALLLVLVAGIGLSRVYLRAHWFSDVVGGFLVGIAWLCLCLSWIERNRRLRHWRGPVKPARISA